MLSSSLGAFAAIFISYFVNFGSPRELYDAGIFGTSTALLIGASFALINLVTALKNPDKAKEQILFSTGIITATILLVALYFLTKDNAQLWFVG